MRGRHLRSRFQVREASDIAVDHRRATIAYGKFTVDRGIFMLSFVTVLA